MISFKSLEYILNYEDYYNFRQYNISSQMDTIFPKDFSSLMEPIGLGNPSRDIRLFALEEPLKIIDELEFQRFKSELFDFKRFQSNL